MSPANIFFITVFSFTGFAYFRFGKKQQRFLYMVSGMSLMVYPYFVSKTVYIALIGIALMLLPLLSKWIEF